MAAAAPFFREFDLPSRGVRLVHPEVCYAHPLDGGRAALSLRSLEETADGLGSDGAAYRRLFGPLVEHGHRRRRLLPHQPAAPSADPQRARGAEVRAHRAAQRALAGPAVLRHRGGAGAAGRGGRARDARPRPAAHRQPRDDAGHAGPPRGLAADRGRLAEAGRRDGRRARGAGRRGRARARGHRSARVRGRARPCCSTPPRGRSWRWPATGCTRATAAGCPATSTGPGVFKVDWVLSEPVPWTNPDVRRVGDHPPRRHPGGDPRRRGGARGRPAHRQALRARGPAHGARPHAGRPRAGTSSGPTCTCRTARTST